MKLLLRLGFHLALAGTSWLTLISCSKNEEPVPHSGPPSGTVSWTLNGRTYTTNNVDGLVAWDGKKLHFKLDAASISVDTTDNVSFELYPIDGVGQYGLGLAVHRFSWSPYNSPASYTRSASSQDIMYFSAGIPYNNHATGSLEIVTFNPVTHRLTGTFEFSGTMASSGDIRRATNGSFNLRY